MHLKNRPTYFVKDGKRKAVFYTVNARELTEAGWVPEEEAPVVAVQEVEVTKETEPVKVEEPIVEPAPTEEAATANLDDMTRAELVEFAEANNIEFKSYASKADILEACKGFVNG